MPKKSVTKVRAVPAVRGGTVPLEVRLKIVQAVKRGGKHADVAMGFGVSLAAVAKYVALFEAGGVEGLKPRLHGAAAQAVARAKAKRAAAPKREAVVEVRKENPDWGTRRIRDVMARFAGLGISETTSSACSPSTSPRPPTGALPSGASASPHTSCATPARSTLSRPPTTSAKCRSGSAMPARRPRMSTCRPTRRRSSR